MNNFLSAFYLVGIIFSFSLVGKPLIPARGFAKILTDDEAENRLASYRSFVLQDLNQSGFHQAYAFRFRLRHMPHRGEDSYQTGTMYGLSIGHGLSRIDLDSDKSFLLQSGIKPKVWEFDSKSKETRVLDEAKLFEPIIDGMNQTPFDILMPFVFWDAKYVKSGKVAGRPAHLFSFSIPKWAKDVRPNLTEIVMALDKSYEAPLRIESFSKFGIPNRTYILNSLKKVEAHWIVKSIDCKDRLDRSNTRFEVTSAALNLDLDLILFSVGGLMNRPSVSVDSFISTE